MEANSIYAFFFFTNADCVTILAFLNLFYLEMLWRGLAKEVSPPVVAADTPDEPAFAVSICSQQVQ